MSFTKLNIIISLSEHLNVVSNSDMKNKKRIEEKEELYEISVLINIYLLSNSEKTIFVCCLIKKQ